MSSDVTQSARLYEVLAWLETNKKSLAIAFGVAVVVGFGIAAYRYSTHQNELAASDALLKLRASPDRSDSTPPAAPAAYLKVAEEYSGTGAGERALLLGASALFTENKYAEAQNEFARFLREQPQSPFAATAAYGIAAALEAQGKQDAALTEYLNLSVRYPNSTVLDEAKLAIARIQEAKGQPALALRAYDELLRLGTMSPASSEARSRRQALLTKHPELAKTNAPSGTVGTVTGAGTNAAAVEATSEGAKVSAEAKAD